MRVDSGVPGQSHRLRSARGHGADPRAAGQFQCAGIGIAEPVAGPDGFRSNGIEHGLRGGAQRRVNTITTTTSAPTIPADRPSSAERAARPGLEHPRRPAQGRTVLGEVRETRQRRLNLLGGGDTFLHNRLRRGLDGGVRQRLDVTGAVGTLCESNGGTWDPGRRKQPMQLATEVWVTATPLQYPLVVDFRSFRG